MSALLCFVSRHTLTCGNFLSVGKTFILSCCSYCSKKQLPDHSITEKRDLRRDCLDVRTSFVSLPALPPSSLLEQVYRVVDLGNEPTAPVTLSWSCDNRIHMVLAVFHSKVGFK